MGHFNITPPVEVAIPSDMSIQVTEVQGADDQPIVLATNYLKFVFFDRERNMVECVHDPTGQTSVNTEYDQDTGTLRLLVPTRGMVTGQLSCKVFTRTADPVTDNSNVKTVPVPKGLEGNPSVTGEIFTDKASYISKARDDAEIDIIKAVRDYNRNIYGTSNMVLETSIGQIQIDNITIEEITKGASNTESYFMKQEIVQNFSEYTNRLKKTGSEAIDLSHNNPKSKFAKRKRMFESMEVFLLEMKWKDFNGKVKAISYCVKLGKYKETGNYHLYSITG